MFKSVSYKKFGTEEVITRPLSTSHPSEEITGLVCPFDNSPILHVYNDVLNHHECPSCNTVYSLVAVNQGAINQEARRKVQKLKIELDQINEDKEEIEKFLQKANERGITAD